MPSPARVRNAPALASHDASPGMLGAERAYRGLTIAAMLVVLSTLWLFR
jgi:hypothetical protein